MLLLFRANATSKSTHHDDEDTRRPGYKRIAAALLKVTGIRATEDDSAEKGAFESQESRHCMRRIGNYYELQNPKVQVRVPEVQSPSSRIPSNSRMVLPKC